MKKFLLIQTAFPGDAILTLPAIQELKAIHPESEIDVVCIPNTQEIFQYSKSVTSTIVLDKNNVHRSFFNMKRFAKELSEKNYDAVYSFHRSIRSSLLTYFIGAKSSYGFDTSKFSFLYKTLVKYDATKHEVERNLSLITERKYEKLPFPKIEADNEMKVIVEKFLAEKNLKKFIAIAPGSVWETKKYPSEKFSKIIDWCLEQNYSVCLIGSKNETELCNILLNTKINVINSAGIFSIVETVELLRYSSILVTNDSAPTHMAMAAGIPALTIYCSTVPEFGFYPYNEKSSFVSLQGLYCKPCGIHGYKICPLGNFKCGNELPWSTVTYEMEKILNDTNRN